MPDKLPFDRQITQDILPVLDDLLFRYPELRGVALLCDFHEPLSRAPGLMRATWKTLNGIKPDSTAGMLRVAVGFQEHLVGVNHKILVALEEIVLEAGNQVLQATQGQSASTNGRDANESQPLPSATGETPSNVESQSDSSTAEKQ